MAGNKAAWRRANPEKDRAYKAAWAKAHPEKARARAKAWYKANKERARASMARWAEAHPERRRAIARKWAKANPDITNALSGKRRARERAATVPLTPEEQAKVIGIYAEARALTEMIGEAYHVDHIVPLSKGGLHHPSNLQVLRGITNIRKGAKLV